MQIAVVNALCNHQGESDLDEGRYSDHVCGGISEIKDSWFAPRRAEELIKVGI
jgi:hypothetical protein